MSAPIVISYYGQIQTFTYTQLYNGEFDGWINNIYNKYKTNSPCQGVLTTTTTTTSTNQVSNIIGNVTNLLSLDLSSITSGVTGGVGSNVGGTTSSGVGNIKSNKNGNNNSNNNSTGNNSETSSNSNGETKGENGGNSSENQGGSVGSEGGGNVDGNNSSNSNSNSSSNSSGSSSGSGGSNNQKTETEKPSEQKIDEQKTETQKTQSNSTAKAASKAKTETQKPAILLTGDIVGVQTKSDGAQDARGTMSFTRVKGDGTASIGFSADYMVNAKIGNVSGIRSWIGTNKKGNKHINVVSGGFGFLPQSTTANALFVRVNSLKNFTALYGVAGTYGKLYKEELISTIAIGGFMYKGKVTKALDATVIMACIYSPYSKFYTESILEAKPIIIPFLNLNYKLTKTFGIGLTAGGTYVANQDVLNYQVLLGAKLKI